MSWVWCDGVWSSDECARVPWTDRGWTHGLGLFETILAVDGKPVFLTRHMDRLERSCAAFGWRMDASAALGAMSELLSRNGLSSGRARIRLAVSGGEGWLRDVRVGKGRKVWMMALAVDEPPASVSVGVSRWKRNEQSPLAGHKSASYGENLFLLQEAGDHGWDEVLVFNHAGHLCEAATANVFLVRDGRLFTPSESSGCLPGVTRGVVVDLAADLGIPCAECDLTEDCLLAADELFLTSSTRGVVPVGRVGDRVLEIGPMSRRLREAWWQRVLGGQNAADWLPLE